MAAQKRKYVTWHLPPFGRSRVLSLPYETYLRTHSSTPVTSTAISPVKMSIGRKSPTDLCSEMIFLPGKPVLF
jgi:hypothetical protein